MDLLKKRLSGLRIGEPLHCFEEVDSTNAVAMRLAEEGATEGTLVLAESQTAGRGRLRRVWQSPAGCNLYFSVVLRPAITPTEAASLTFVGAVAAFSALSRYCSGGIEIKWPNDILINRRKVCGILTEMKTDGRNVEVVMGVGININMKKGGFAPELRRKATSLAEETGKEFFREDVLFSFCERFQHWYGVFLREGFAPIKKEWLSATAMVGKSVRVQFRDEVKQGLVLGIDDDGALLLVDSEKTVQRITAGDATVMRAEGG
jgi:BirA family transcriptional regulator, biotin operon repressor / biotin---[acetyl-CoA-carboxylase] ligase